MKLGLKYIEENEELYANVEDLIKILQLLTINSDDRIDKSSSVVEETNLIKQIKKFGKISARKVLSMMIEILDKKYTYFEIVDKK